MDNQRRSPLLSEIIRQKPQATSKSRPASGRRCTNIERQFVKKREKEFIHQQTWDGQVKYYETFKNANDHYECWTSPRYYHTNNKVANDYSKKKKKEEDLIDRREKLRKLFDEENRSYQIELMVRNRDKYLSPRSRTQVESPATSVLREVNLGIQQLEEDRRHHEAEIKLYHQWRQNNPIVRHHERLRNCRDIKLSWLDQQVEKRMEMEKAQEEYKKMLKEREKLIEEEKLKEEKLQRDISEKNKHLQEELQKQVEVLKIKQQEEQRLEQLEFEEMQQKLKLLDLEEKQKEDDKRRLARENALSNIRQWQLKLKEKAKMIEENLQSDEKLLEKIKESQVAERLENEMRKCEIKQAMDELLKYTRQQMELEKKRQMYLSFVFDSEAQCMYEKQQEIWNAEELARKQLLQDVLVSIKSQIEEKMESNRRQRAKILEEKDDIERSINNYDEQLKMLKEEEEMKKMQWKKEIDVQLKEKTLKKKEMKLLEQKRVEDELEEVRKEEERLRKEIADIQRRPYSSRPCRSSIFLR